MSSSIQMNAQVHSAAQQKTDYRYCSFIVHEL
jgi:hypothetical protein